jgi:hypothetical protein
MSYKDIMITSRKAFNESARGPLIDIISSTLKQKRASRIYDNESIAIGFGLSRLIDDQDEPEYEYESHHIRTKQYQKVDDALNDFSEQLKEEGISPENKEYIFWRLDPELFCDIVFESEYIQYRIEARFVYAIKIQPCNNQQLSPENG